MKRVIRLCILALFLVILSACNGNAPPAPVGGDAHIVPSTAPSPDVSAMPVPVESTLDAPSWEIALEEFLSELLPIFTPGIMNEWREWEAGRWLPFVHSYMFTDEQGWEHTGFYIADPVTGERADADTPYVLMWQYEFEHEVWTATFIATSFYLHDIDGGGIPALLIRWYPPGGDFESVQMFRYINGRYTPMDISMRHFWNLDEVIETPFLFETALFSGGSELLARDSEGRTIILGIGGAGGFGTWAHILHMTDGGVRLAPFFNIRFEWGSEGGEEMRLNLFVDESITGERGFLSEIEQEDALFFPWEWLHGKGDMTPVPIPIMPDVTVTPFPRMTDLEQQLTERITARLLAEGRILP